MILGSSNASNVRVENRVVTEQVVLCDTIEIEFLSLAKFLISIFKSFKLE